MQHMDTTCLVIFNDKSFDLLDFFIIALRTKQV